MSSFVSSCGEDDEDSTVDSPTSSGASCIDNGTEISIGSDHGHSLTVPKEDVIAAVEKSYDIKGSSGHTHSVTLSQSDFDKLAQDQSVSVTSTTENNHSHQISVSCAS